MKTRILPLLPLLILMMVCPDGRMKAAPPADDAAKARAEIFQKEARAVFVRRGWLISMDKPGKLVAEHHIGFPMGAGTVMEELLDTNITGVAQAIITFQPKTATSTSCVAKLKRHNYVENDKSPGHYFTTGPYDLDAPHILAVVNDNLEKARRRMFAAHPEYAAK